MTRPRFGEANLGALTGAIVGSIGGLFAFGTVRAVAHHDITLIFRTPVLGTICFLVAGVAGWFLGGQIGPRLAGESQNRNLEAIGGLLGGLIPVLLITLLGWYKLTR
jgi:hypothetical protein